MNKIGFAAFLTIMVAGIWLLPTTNAVACGCRKARRVGNKVVVGCNPKMGCKMGSCGCSKRRPTRQQVRRARRRALALARRRQLRSPFPDGPVCREPKKNIKLAKKEKTKKRKRK